MFSPLKPVSPKVGHDGQRGGDTRRGDDRDGGGVRGLPQGCLHEVRHGEGDDKSAVFSRWGELLRQYHGKATDGRHTDVATNYLGYWTDNGAFYYYNTLPNMTYQVEEAFRKKRKVSIWE